MSWDSIGILSAKTIEAIERAVCIDGIAAALAIHFLEGREGEITSVSDPVLLRLTGHVAFRPLILAKVLWGCAHRVRDHARPGRPGGPRGLAVYDHDLPVNAPMRHIDE